MVHQIVRICILVSSLRERAHCDLDERLLAAAREDNEEMLLEVFEEGKFDINFKDG